MTLVVLIMYARGLKPDEKIDYLRWENVFATVVCCSQTHRGCQTLFLFCSRHECWRRSTFKFFHFFMNIERSPAVTILARLTRNRQHNFIDPFPFAELEDDILQDLLTSHQTSVSPPSRSSSLLPPSSRPPPNPTLSHRNPANTPECLLPRVADHHVHPQAPGDSETSELCHSLAVEI